MVARRSAKDKLLFADISAPTMGCDAGLPFAVTRCQLRHQRPHRRLALILRAFITAVDGLPDIEAALKDQATPQIQAPASQDPFVMARRAVQIGLGIVSGQKPTSAVEPLPSKLVTRDNVAEYKGWTSDRSQ
jgi:hypothetical protein